MRSDSARTTAVDVVGNNLANLNTPGFKTNVVYFRDVEHARSYGLRACLRCAPGAAEAPGLRDS